MSLERLVPVAVSQVGSSQNEIAGQIYRTLLRRVLVHQNNSSTTFGPPSEKLFECKLLWPCFFALETKLEDVGLDFQNP